MVLEDPGQPAGDVGRRRTTRPDLRRRPVRWGLRAGHRVNAEATRGSAGAGEGARHRRTRVPTAEARRGEGRTERRISRNGSDPGIVTLRDSRSRGQATRARSSAVTCESRWRSACTPMIHSYAARYGILAGSRQGRLANWGDGRRCTWRGLGGQGGRRTRRERVPGDVGC